jgi:antitoxin (DNA-binding transcriptional repressor) of toxin-antitoxin stability system
LNKPCYPNAKETSKLVQNKIGCLPRVTKLILAGKIDFVHFLVHHIAVKRVNFHDAKTNLSRYFAKLVRGEALVLCSRNRPVAERWSPQKRQVREPRIGVAKGLFKVPDSFFEPLSDAVLKAFGGK